MDIALYMQTFVDISFYRTKKTALSYCDKGGIHQNVTLLNLKYSRKVE